MGEDEKMRAKDGVMLVGLCVGALLASAGAAAIWGAGGFVLGLGLAALAWGVAAAADK